MTYSNQLDRIVAPASTKYNKGRAGVTISHIVLHHQAGFSSNTLYVMSTNGTRKVSANGVVNKDGTSVGVVREEDTPYTNGHLGWNRKSLTLEIENSAVGDASGWPISDAAHEETARIVADWCRRYNIPATRDRIIGHNELYTKHKAGYATACPGKLRIDWIVARVNELLGASPLPAKPAPAVVTKSASNPNGRVFVDGIFGEQTIRKLQYALGYRSAAYLDGSFGPVTRKKLQAKLRQVKDGNFGPVSVKALQRHLGFTGRYVDGSWGAVTTKRLQERLNAGRF